MGPNHIMAGHTTNTQGDPNEGACGYRSAEKANIIRMGLSDIYNPKRRIRQYVLSAIFGS